MLFVDIKYDVVHTRKPDMDLDHFVTEPSFRRAAYQCKSVDSALVMLDGFMSMNVPVKQWYESRQVVAIMRMLDQHRYDIDSHEEAAMEVLHEKMPVDDLRQLIMDKVKEHFRSAVVKVVL